MRASARKAALVVIGVVAWSVAHPISAVVIRADLGGGQAGVLVCDPTAYGVRVPLDGVAYGAATKCVAPYYDGYNVFVGPPLISLEARLEKRPIDLSIDWTRVDLHTSGFNFGYGAVLWPPRQYYGGNFVTSLYRIVPRVCWSYPGSNDCEDGFPFYL